MANGINERQFHQLHLLPLQIADCRLQIMRRQDLHR
jgi:hypothetical protein